jgi:hypothetical protein
LVGGVAQMQATVYAAVEAIGQTLSPQDEMGDPTGEMLFNIEPRAAFFLACVAAMELEGVALEEIKFSFSQ